MDWLSNFATMNNFTAIVIVVAIIFLAIGIHRGSISFKGKGLEIGNEQERKVIQRQTTYIHGRMDAIANILLKDHPDLNEYKTKWICKCIELELVRSIHYNHIEDTEGYRTDRFIAIRDIIQRKTDNDYFYSDGFYSFLKDFIQEAVKQLISIRKLV